MAARRFGDGAATLTQQFEEPELPPADTNDDAQQLKVLYLPDNSTSRSAKPLRTLRQMIPVSGNFSDGSSSMGPSWYRGSGGQSRWNTVVAAAKTLQIPVCQWSRGPPQDFVEPDHLSHNGGGTSIDCIVPVPGQENPKFPEWPTVDVLGKSRTLEAVVVYTDGETSDPSVENAAPFFEAFSFGAVVIVDESGPHTEVSGMNISVAMPLLAGTSSGILCHQKTETQTLSVLYATGVVKDSLEQRGILVPDITPEKTLGQFPTCSVEGLLDLVVESGDASKKIPGTIEVKLPMSVIVSCLLGHFLDAGLGTIEWESGEGVDVEGVDVEGVDVEGVGLHVDRLFDMLGSRSTYQKAIAILDALSDQEVSQLIVKLKVQRLIEKARRMATTANDCANGDFGRLDGEDRASSGDPRVMHLLRRIHACNRDDETTQRDTLRKELDAIVRQNPSSSKPTKEEVDRAAKRREERSLIGRTLDRILNGLADIDRAGFSMDALNAGGNRAARAHMSAVGPGGKAKTRSSTDKCNFGPSPPFGQASCVCFKHTPEHAHDNFGDDKGSNYGTFPFGSGSHNQPTNHPDECTVTPMVVNKEVAMAMSSDDLSLIPVPVVPLDSQTNLTVVSEALRAALFGTIPSVNWQHAWPLALTAMFKAQHDHRDDAEWAEALPMLDYMCGQILTHVMVPEGFKQGVEGAPKISMLGALVGIANNHSVTTDRPHADVVTIFAILCKYGSTCGHATTGNYEKALRAYLYLVVASMVSFSNGEHSPSKTDRIPNTLVTKAVLSALYEKLNVGQSHIAPVAGFEKIPSWGDVVGVSCAAVKSRGVAAFNALPMEPLDHYVWASGVSMETVIKPGVWFVLWASLWHGNKFHGKRGSVLDHLVASGRQGRTKGYPKEPVEVYFGKDTSGVPTGSEVFASARAELAERNVSHDIFMPGFVTVQSGPPVFAFVDPETGHFSHLVPQDGTGWTLDQIAAHARSDLSRKMGEVYKTGVDCVVLHSSTITDVHRQVRECLEQGGSLNTPDCVDLLVAHTIDEGRGNAYQDLQPIFEVLVADAERAQKESPCTDLTRLAYEERVFAQLMVLQSKGLVVKNNNNKWEFTPLFFQTPPHVQKIDYPAPTVVNE
jgi:hypothetical protein